ncbi:MAG TPA: hypothetical protein VFU81_19430 [Thermomicrobiales bacterium]|nr:hypothetical protein [Thermomicrobiales bacterium]
MRRRQSIPPARARLGARLATAATALVLLAGCSGLAAPPPPPETTPTPVPSPTPPARPAAMKRSPCSLAYLTVGDLIAIDSQWAAGVQAATEQAKSWRPDARLVSLQVGCAPLEDGYRWQGVYFSPAAQSFYYSDSAFTEPAEADPNAVPTLPLDRISFTQLHLALAHAGYGDGAPLDAAGGVEVRLNTASDPYGPPGTPQDVVYHVAIEDQGQVRDIFVSGQNWTIYSYQDAG